MKKTKKKDGIVATFKNLDELCDTMEKIDARADFEGHEAYAPTSYHELMEIAEKRYGESQVRYFTLVGALTGVITGFGMPLWMDYDWSIVVGGKTAGIYSIPAYVVFGFELMVLFGAIATILGMLVMGRLPDPLARIYDKRITNDRFAIFVPDALPDGAQAKLLLECGAEKVVATPLV